MRRPFRRLRRLTPTLALLILPCMGFADRMEAQEVNDRAARFAAAWAEARLAPAEPLLAETVRLTLEGRTHTGVRGRQVIATLTPILDANLPAAPLLVRLEQTGEDNQGAFAEFRWESSDRDTGAAIGYTLLLIFERVESSWLIVELRVMP